MVVHEASLRLGMMLAGGEWVYFSIRMDRSGWRHSIIWFSTISCKKSALNAAAWALPGQVKWVLDDADLLNSPYAQETRLFC